MIRLLLVDDHELVRTGLRTFLELQDDMAVVGEAATGEQALALAADLEPDIVLLDLALPGMTGLDVLVRLRAAQPEVRVVVLTSFAGQDSVLPAVRAGVSGYLLKDVGPTELADALRSVHAGGAPLHPQVAATVMRSVTAVDPLTPREREVSPAHRARAVQPADRARARAVREDRQGACQRDPRQARGERPHPGRPARRTRRPRRNARPAAQRGERALAAPSASHSRGRRCQLRILCHTSGTRRRGPARRGRVVLGPRSLLGRAPRPMARRSLPTTVDLMQTAIITGASRGLGRALAESLAADEWQLVLDARTANDLAGAAAGWPTAVTLPGDVTDEAHRVELVEAAGERLDLLVLNASSLGQAPLPPLESYRLDELRAVLETNTVAPLRLIQLALPALRAAGGRIIAISSDAAVEGYEGWGGYGASKAALDQLVRVLAAEEPDLRIYAADPGDMRTRMHADAYPGEDISDRPEPETVVPTLRRLITDPLPSGRYSVTDLAVTA